MAPGSRRLMAAWAAAMAAVALSNEGGDAPALSFLAVGDWGGGSDKSPTSEGEVCTASGMGKVARELNASFVLGLGDNFYDIGINPFNQGRLASTFDEVFTDESLQVDWWFVAGNHDHLGLIRYQVHFSEKLPRWKFPAYWYTFEKSLPSGKTAQFVMFDSVTAAGLSYHDEAGDLFVAAPGPENATEAESQWQWLEGQLAGSQADYLFTVSHYPVWSACMHGPTKYLVSRLRPLLRKYRVTAHLAGHDHCLNHIEEDGTAHVLSGAGSKAWYKLSNAGKLQNATLSWSMSRENSQGHKGGFAAASLSDTGAVISYYADDATLLYTAKPIPPRTVDNLGNLAV